MKRSTISWIKHYLDHCTFYGHPFGKQLHDKIFQTVSVHMLFRCKRPEPSALEIG